MSATRPDAVAGLFYPDNPIKLKHTFTDLLANARAATLSRAPKAPIVPHAGFIYSGAVAASAYVRLGGLREHIRRVIPLAPPSCLCLRAGTARGGALCDPAW